MGSSGGCTCASCRGNRPVAKTLPLAAIALWVGFCAGPTLAAQPQIPTVLKDSDCRTDAGKADAAFDYIWERHDPQDAAVFPVGPPWDGKTFRVGFFVPQKQRHCTGRLVIADDCRVSEDLECAFATE